MGRWLAPAAAAVMAVAMAAFAWPSLLAGAIVAPYAHLPRDMARGATVADATLNEAIEAARVSLGWRDRPATRAFDGALHLVRAGRSATRSAQREALDRSVAALRASLSAAPAQPYGWLQLTQALRARDGRTPALNAPLRASLRTAPFEHRLVMPRVEIALEGWQLLAPDLRAAMAGQLRRAVDTAPVALAAATRRHYALRQVRRALATSPTHLERFTIVYLSRD